MGVSYNGIISGSNPQDKGSIPLAPANIYTRITQLVECFLDVEEVVSSSLAVSTIRITAYPLRVRLNFLKLQPCQKGKTKLSGGD